MPTAPLPKAVTWIVTADALNGRTGPSTSKPIKKDSKGRKIILHKGDKVYARREVKGGGRTWLVTRYGTYYAKDFCAKPGKATSSSGRVASPVPGRRVTTPWGKKPPYRNGRPLYWTTRGRHTGSDRAAPTSAKVVALNAGTVRYRWDPVLGNVVLLYTRSTRGTKITFWYCHLSRVLIKNGQSVKRGQTLGEVGATGSGARGPHLHLEVRYGWTTSWSGRDYNPEVFW